MKISAPELKNFSKENSFDFLRLLFASLVIISHSFPLTGVPEIISEFTSKQTDLGKISVESFFIISGFLIYQSLHRSKTVSGYIWKRILRLYPALLGMLLFTLLLLPVVFTENNLLMQQDFWTYFPRALSLYDTQFKMDGIFENNPFPNYINGSLWTLSYEFSMYLIILLFFPLKKLNSAFFILILMSAACYFLMLMRPNFLMNVLQIFHLNAPGFYRLAFYFLAGSLLNYFDFSKYNNLWTRVFFFSLFCLLLTTDYYTIFAPIVLPITVMLFGTLRMNAVSAVLKKSGDLSYGVYIYAFLIQQTLMYYFSFSVPELIISTVFITYFLSYFSWHLIEKKMLKFKGFYK